MKIAWRNIWRNKRRTLLTTMGIAVSCSVLVFFIGLQLSSYATAINASTRLFQGHIQVQRKGFLEKPEVRLALEDILSLRAAVEDLPGVQAAGARGVAFALVSSETRSYGAQIVGVEPDREKRITTLAGVVREGSFFQGRADIPQAVLGRTLANNLRAKLGDELTIMGQGADGSFAVGVLQIGGIFESGSKEVDRHFVLTPLEAFQEIFSLPEAGHMVAIIGEDVEQSEALIDGIEKLVGQRDWKADYRPLVLGWQALTPGLKEAIDLDMASGWIFYLSLVLIVTFSVLNTFVMSILERTREFGLLLALGMRPIQITRMVLAECFLLLLTGIVPGLLLGAAIIVYFGIFGFYLPGSEEILRLWNIPGAVHTKLSLPALTVGPIVLLVFCLTVVLIPALRIRRLEAVEAMRTV